MAGGSGGATTEQLIFRAQKSTNHLKALLAKLLPVAAGGGYGAGAKCSGGDVDALLSDITDSLSQAITSLRIPTVGQPAAASTAAGRSPAGAGGRRSAATRRTSQRARMDAASRMIVLQNGVHDSYTWRKYGQKEILGARFPRSYYKCGRRPGCPAKKHVQQCDADPSKLEITYFEAHTCDDRPPSSSHSVPDPTTGSDALLVPATAVPLPSAHCYGGRPSSPLHQVPYATTIGSSNVLTTTGRLLPVAAVPGALPSASYDPVPDVTDCTPSLEQEQAHDLLHIPSPACSQSELLPVEVDCDFAVPEI
ncbi:unnamed protein product [Miscanthus lutarioriparius]|uniref:WRKY domain-containing protein n=1 Tax=Miscanthus lutarioriparius TaxID=422564 RepID=A0A811N9I9_9POAL|nr:unnamed protein product [Miscanthus lutarioriparius]